MRVMMGAVVLDDLHGADRSSLPLLVPVVNRVSRRTRGNPFFVGELGALPRLSAPCRDVVSAAAVLGSDLDTAGIAARVAAETRTDER